MIAALRWLGEWLALHLQTFGVNLNCAHVYHMYGWCCVLPVCVEIELLEPTNYRL